MTDVAASDLVHIGEYFALLRREKWRMIAVASVIGIAAATIATAWPPTYRSTATILAEEADIPADLVTSTVRTMARERIQAIQQRIITTANLANIINKYDLYAEERNSFSLTQIANQMRGNINLSLVSTDTDAKGGRDTRTTIAFTLSFDGDAPQTTQQVTSELASLFLSESRRERDERASGTTSFLKAEAQRLHAGVQILESRLETFRVENAGYLPEDRLINTQLLDQAENRLLDLTRQIQTLRQRQGIIRAQLAGTPAQPPPSRDRTVLSPPEQLALLQTKRAELRAKYGVKHPDVIALGRQIDALSAAVSGGSIDQTALKLRGQSLQADLVSARQKYGAKHPDALRLERELKAVQDELAAAPVAIALPQSAMNPDYLQLQAELASVGAELQAVMAQQQSTEDKKSEIEERILKGPMIERDYIALKRDHDAAVAKYLEVRSKAAEAELTKNLETQQMGETFTLIEPPVEPTFPIKPNRRAILAIGLMAAIVSGVIFGILHDAADQRVHGWRQLAAITGQSPFAVVPFIRTTKDRRRAGRAAILQILAGFLVLATALFYVNLFVTPLNAVWSVVADHFDVGADKSALPPEN